jgi:predicted nuclease with TOPRIM domain
MTEMEEDDMDEDEINHGDDVESEVSHTSFVNPFANRLDKDDSHCGYCLNEYSNIMEVVDEQKELILELQREYLKLAEKLEQERDKTDRLENELNTLTDLYQNGNMELKSQLAQMERVTFSKSQDLEDNIDNCQIRLHKLEVQITNSANSSEKPLPSNGVVRKVGVPALSHLLNFIAVCFKVSEHIG